MENLAETNDFIDLFEKLYDEVHMKQIPKEVVEIKNESVKKGYFRRKFEKDEPTPKIDYVVYDDIESAYRHFKNYLNKILSNQAQKFWTLWKFCQFVRWAEKVFLYYNNPNIELMSPLICVDSPMTGDEREFAFCFNGCKVYFKLQLVEKPRVKITESAYSEVITIVVSRDYGKKMENKIIVVDGDTELNDDSDTYMINGINMQLNKAIRLTTENILENLLGEDTYDKLSHIDKGFYINI